MVEIPSSPLGDPCSPLNPTERRSSAGQSRPCHAGGAALVGLDEPWASGQRKRYLNSLQAGELAA